ncbi:MAG: response regulator [Bacteroidota bacterium]|nr:response regulator [Bacteroidota bacterium]
MSVTKSPRAKILLVDDRENNLISMESVLWPDGYQLVKAQSGKAALKILLNEMDFTLILMDVEMPEINGFETATMIYQREKLRHIPIIFITAHSYGDENLFKGYKAGAVDYIYKPVQPELLRAKVAIFAELFKKTHQLIAQEEKLIAINRNLEQEMMERIASETRANELNKQLFENIHQLESTNKELDRFAYMASHDLQEPLRKIKIFNDRLYSKFSEKMDPEAMLYMEKMQSACTRMQNLINDILAFSKLSLAKDLLVLTDLNVLIEEVIADMDLQIQEKNAQVIVEKLPRMHVHPRLIKPLFQNLISNALKYSRKGVDPVVLISSKVDTTVNGSERMTVNKFVRISIQDNGIGFEQQYAEQVFAMFKRLHVNSDYEGTGIGLAICKKIVEEHNGFISATSEVDKGSTFIISLPVDAPVVPLPLAMPMNT